MRKGFTLVELSIVLVIIGLLIGGILAAQSMISAANTNKLVQRIQQFDVAVTNFKTKYKTIPGDARAMGCGGGWDACDDGILIDAIGRPLVRQSDNGVAWNAQVWGDEWSNFWIQLQKSGFTYNGATFVNTPLTATGILNSGTTLNAPGAEMINKQVSILALGVGRQEAELPDQGKLYYGICNYTHDIDWPGSSNTYCGETSNVPPVFALALDTKMDDGRSRSGIMWSYDMRNWQNTCNTANSPQNSYPTLNTSGTYNPSAVGASDSGCGVFIRVGGANPPD